MKWPHFLIQIPSRCKWSSYFLSVSLAVIAFCLYLPTLKSDFVYDARAQILCDNYIHDTGNFAEILSLKVLTRDVIDRRRPAHLLFLMIDAAIWEKQPAGYHLTSILLHTACVVLLFFLFIRLLKGWPLGESPSGSRVRLAAAAGAVLFAIHPLMCEPVCEVSYREDLLLAFFVLSGLIFALTISGSDGLKNHLLALGCLLCLLLACASKESGIIGTPILLVLWFLFKRGSGRQPWIWLLPSAVIVCTMFVAAMFFLGPNASQMLVTRAGYVGGSFLAALKVQPRIWMFQLQLLVFPTNLCADYSPWSLRHISISVAVFVLLATWGLVFFFAQHNRQAYLGAVIWWLALLPTSNLVPMYQPIGDRLLYLPMVGMSLIATAALYILLSQRSSIRRMVICIFLVTCTALVVLNIKRQHIWRNEMSLWEDTSRNNPFSIAAANNLGFALFRGGEFRHAVDAWQRAVQLSGGKQSDPWAGLAIGFNALGKDQDADKAFLRALDLDARYGNTNQLKNALFWEEIYASRLIFIAKRLGYK